MGVVVRPCRRPVCLIFLRRTPWARQKVEELYRRSL
ncbi:VF530 family DNA-binding protein [Perlucidibaca piscinae]